MNDTSAHASPVATLRAYVAIARPDHWFKNAFMVLGVLLAVSYQPDALLGAAAAARLLLAVVATCLVASSNYVLNEILDAPHDRHHPLKRQRPIPSGLVSIPIAYVEWIALAVVAGALAWRVNWPFFLSAVWLWVMGVLYNVPPVRTKEWPYLDVLSESVNNPIRLWLGWFALVDSHLPPISLAIAYWMAGAFLMAVKRYAEYRHIGNPAVAMAYRRSFRHYTEERLLISILFYAVVGAVFGGIFIVRYHVELVFCAPLIAGLFAHYLKLGMLADSPAQRPERLYRHAGFMAYLTICLVTFAVLLFTRMPGLYRYLEVEPSTMRELWHVGSDEGTPAVKADDTMDDLSRDYVRLVLALGVHDPDAVDAFYGPADVQQAVTQRREPLPAVRAQIAVLRRSLEARPVPTSADDAWRLRMLRAQARALDTRAAITAGERFAFDAESLALYAAAAPTHDEAHFDALLVSLEGALPGSGTLAQRYERYRAAFIIPPDRLDRVFRAAIAACRERTLAHVALPAGESFTLEYVRDKPWSGYNWYKGRYQSVIQVNTDLPIFIDRALDLACHEGYPGHHVYNVLLEQGLVRERGWAEWSIYPLFSPQSLIAEGTANFGIAVAFPQEQRLIFERDVLYPLAGLDPSRAEQYQEVQRLAGQLAYAGNEAARRYLDGGATVDVAVAWLERYALMSRERAEQRVRFFDRYRSYVINYNLGEDLVEQYVDAQGGVAGAPDRRWQVFLDLLRRPKLPSELVSPR
ncbi:MAG TPA: UbiA prenyltransferase family protein [Luteitalea sp.]|nr:UbiA prenyltransferase family protein [Luteitalea sp.]